MHLKMRFALCATTKRITMHKLFLTHLHFYSIPTMKAVEVMWTMPSPSLMINQWQENQVNPTETIGAHLHCGCLAGVTKRPMHQFCAIRFVSGWLFSMHQAFKKVKWSVRQLCFALWHDYENEKPFVKPLLLLRINWHFFRARTPLLKWHSEVLKLWIGSFHCVLREQLTWKEPNACLFFWRDAFLY